MQPTHPRVIDLARFGEWFARSLANNDRKNGTCAILSGAPGTGKSHVARRIYRFAQSWNVWMADTHRTPPQPFWVDWADIADGDEEIFRNTIYEVERSRFVAIDDLGSETDRFKSGTPTARLRRVLEKLDGKWVFATTNLTKAMLLESYDARVADRLRGFRWFELRDVPSYRVAKNQNTPNSNHAPSNAV